MLLKSTTADSRGFTVKLADFGMARLLAENSTHVSTKTYGTISYMPIEVLKHGKLTRAVDSYSFAIIMWELFKGEVLYSDMTVAQVASAFFLSYCPTKCQNVACQDLQPEAVQAVVLFDSEGQCKAVCHSC